MSKSIYTMRTKSISTREWLFGLALFGLTLSCLILPCAASPEIPGAPQEEPIAIVGATIHPVDAKPIKNGVLIFDKGMITSIGDSDTEVPEDAEVIKAKGKHVYPGLFNTDGILGLIEINSIRATADQREVGQLNPNVRADKAINPDSELIPVTRSGGVLFNLTAPTGGLIMGTSAVLQLDGWTTEDMTLLAPAALHINWPAPHAPQHHDDDEEEDKEHGNADDRFHQLEEVIERAAAYQKARENNPSQPIDLRWESFLPVIAGEVPIVATAEHVNQIQTAVAFASRHKLKLIIYGGNDAVECAELLKSENVPVIINGVYRLPLRRHEAYDSAYTLPARLHKAGVKFCIAGSARFDASNIRNLPYHAATAVGFGLPEDQALRAITLSPAEILGVDKKVGSLSVGKHASLIIADGPIFDTASNVVEAFLQGRKVDLSDRHKRLYKKYKARK